jgi:PAS domain S-box-containing protein
MLWAILISRRTAVDDAKEGGYMDRRDFEGQFLLVSLVESSHDAIIGKTLDGIITSWNPGAERIYGYRREEVLGKPMSLLVPPGRENELPDIFERIKVRHQVEHHVTERIRKDGTVIDVSVTVSPIKDVEGNVVGVSSIARDVTAVRQVSQYARSLIEASPDPLVTISPEGKITDVNEATVKVTGVPREKLIGTDFSDYFTEPDKAREGYQRILSQGFVTDYPLTIRHQDGRLTDVLYNASNYKDVRGKVLGVLAVARDVTAVRHASQYARSLIEAGLDPLVTISPEGKINDVNEATVKVTGVPREKLIGTDFSDYFTEPDKAREGYQRVLSQGLVTDYPLTIRHQDGRLTDVLYNISVYKDVRGKVLGVLAAARDVTAQKKVEAQIKELDRLADLERFQKLTVGRELKMIELKREIEDLKRRLEHRA